MSFRIDPKQGLTQENISAAQNLAGLLQNNETFCVRLKCTLVVRQKLNCGESLYIRGAETENTFTINMSVPNWNKGTQLKNQNPDTWVTPIEINIDKCRKAAFKFLINDKQWENGEDHDLQDLLFLAQNSLSVTPKAGNYAKERVQKNMHCESQNLQFRINPQHKLSKEKILKVENLATDFERNPLLSVRLAGDLIVRCQLQFNESLYVRGELTQGDKLPFQAEIGNFSVNNLSSALGWETPSWKKGIKLQNINADTWSILFTFRADSSHEIRFKFLIDDKHWEDGEDHNLQDLLFLAQEDLTKKEEPSDTLEELERQLRQAEIEGKQYEEQRKQREIENEKQQKKSEESRKRRETEYENRCKQYEEQWKQKPTEWASFFNTSCSNFGSNMNSSYAYTPLKTSSSNPNYAYSSYYSSTPRPNNNTSSSNYSSYSSSGTSWIYADSNKEANEIKGKLERIFGATISDANSLNKAFNKWSLKNHPDKQGNEEAATKTFQDTVELRNKLKELKKW
jgi:hypothetical protein